MRNSIRFTVMLLVVLGSQVTIAQPLADRLPPQTLVYAGWSPGAALHNTLPAKMLADERFVRPWRLLIQQALSLPELVGVAEAGAESKLAEQLPLLLTDAVQCEAAFALLDLKKVGREWSPQAVLIINLGDKRKAFENHFKPIQERLKTRLGDRIHMMKLEKSWLWMKTTKEVPEYTWGFLGDSFVFYFGDGGEKFLASLSADKPADSLRTAPNFAQTFEKLPGDAFLTTYIDLTSARGLLQTVLRDSTNSDLAAASLMWNNTATAIGIDNAAALGQKMRVEEDQFVSHTLFRTQGPPHGLLSQLVQPAVDDSMLKAIPTDAMAAVAFRLDVAKLYEAVKETAVTIAGEDARKSFGIFEDEAADRGVPVAKLLAPFGDQWVFYNANSTGGFPFFGITAVVSVRDADKLHQALSGVERLLSKMADGGGMRLTSYDADGVTIRYLQSTNGSSFVSPAYAVTGERLVIALYPQIVEDAVKQLNGDGKSLLDLPDFISRRKQTVGGGPLIYFSQTEVVKEVYPLVLPLVSLIRAFGGMRHGEEGEVPMEDLVPSMRRLLSYTGDEVVSVKLTPDGIAVNRSVANPLLSPLSIADAAPLVIAVTVPMLGKAGVEADRQTSTTHLMRIGQSLLLYANDNKDKYPRDLETAIRAQGVGDEILKSPFGPGKNGRDYQYLYVEGMTSGLDAAVVVAYDNAQLEQGEGTSLLFADGHVDWLDREAVAGALKKSEGMVKNKFEKK